jgi:hypothetical protein
MPNIDIDDFLAGEGLEYRGYRRSCVATYRAGVGTNHNLKRYLLILNGF